MLQLINCLTSIFGGGDESTLPTKFSFEYYEKKKRFRKMTLKKLFDQVPETEHSQFVHEQLSLLNCFETLSRTKSHRLPVNDHLGTELGLSGLL